MQIAVELSHYQNIILPFVILNTLRILYPGDSNCPTGYVTAYESSILLFIVVLDFIVISVVGPRNVINELVNQYVTRIILIVFLF